MRRDSILYKIFQQFPALLFELVEEKPENAENYRFESVAVKEPKFEIDGVLLPPESSPPGIVYFSEFQFQLVDDLYERMFGELFLYFRRNRQYFSDWRAVAIYPSRSKEQRDRTPYQMLLDSDHVTRIYLNELGAIETLPPELALLVLTIVPKKQAPQAAREILGRAPRSTHPQVIIDVVSTIISYKFSTLSRKEIDKMLGITFEETRVYQEAKEEGQQEGKQLDRLAVLSLLLNQKLGTLPKPLEARISALSFTQLEGLTNALLSFNTLEDLATWLKANA